MNNGMINDMNNYQYKNIILKVEWRFYSMLYIINYATSLANYEHFCNEINIMIEINLYA